MIRINRKAILTGAWCLWFGNSVVLGQTNVVKALTTDLICETDVIFINGERSDLDIKDFDYHNQDMQVAYIKSPKPCLGWQLDTQNKNIKQESYRIIVSSQLDKCLNDNGDVWDSGIVQDDSQQGIRIGNDNLTPNTLYYWKVIVTEKDKQKTWVSEPKAFWTYGELSGKISHLPLEKITEKPIRISQNNQGTLYDFGKDGFGQLSVWPNVETIGHTDIKLGEVSDSNGINPAPGGARRFKEIGIDIYNKSQWYNINIPTNIENTYGHNESCVPHILMPRYIGEVLPFRYCQTSHNMADSVTRKLVIYPFDDEESYFESSDTILNQLYELSKWTMKATSFAGIMVDGDRERIPYEADIYINQLSHYAVSSQYSLARRSIEHVIEHPTWPTEWILYTVLLAWNDYLYTGDKTLIDKYYEKLKNKTLYKIRRNSDGLLHTGNKITDISTKMDVGFMGSEIKDIVDWPHHGRNIKGEDDNFVYEECNSVVNSMHLKAVMLMAQIAETLGYRNDAKMFGDMAQKTSESIEKHMMKDNLYKDGIITSHQSLHANMFPLALGTAPENSISEIINMIKSKGMACSVYGAQMLLDAVYNAGYGDYGYELLTKTDKRSFYNMIAMGSTMTTEAWDNSFKPNQDWNHAWGSACGNVIVRKLMGIEPQEPGFEKVRIKPQPGQVARARIKVPTPRGPITMSFENRKKFKMEITIPANMTAEVWLPEAEKPMIIGSGHYKM